MRAYATRTCMRLGCGGRPLLLPVCRAQQHAIDVQHLQRSLELAPAVKHADFEYVAVAFRTEPRPKRNRVQRGRDKQEGGALGKIFGEAKDDKGYRTLEVVSGDRRLLFEDPTTKPSRTSAEQADAADAAEGPSTSGAGSEHGAAKRAGRGRPRPAKPAHASKLTPAPPGLGSSEAAHLAAVPSSRPTAAPSGRAGVAGHPSAATAEVAITAGAATTAAVPGAGTPMRLARHGKASRAQPPHAQTSSSFTAAEPSASTPSSAVCTAAQQPGPQDDTPAPNTSFRPATSPLAPPPQPAANSNPNAKSKPVPTRGGQPEGGAHRGGEYHHRRDSDQPPRSTPPSGGSQPGPRASRRRDGGAERPVPLANARNRVRLVENIAAGLLGMGIKEIRSHRGFHTELLALQTRPAALQLVAGVLRRELGLTREQLRAALLGQPHLLRTQPGELAARGAAMAVEMGVAVEPPPPPPPGGNGGGEELAACGAARLAEMGQEAEPPPPPGGGSGGELAAATATAPGGGGELAAAVAAAPNALMLRTGHAGAAAALAAALGLPLPGARAMLRRHPALLCHPPATYARSLAALRSQTGLPPRAAAALAAAEPALLAVSPGVLVANASLLGRTLQLSGPQLAAVVGAAPWLLARSPGTLRAAAQRLVSCLHYSPHWRPQLERLLSGSPRNVAVALSFGSERYERLQYLAASGRDRTMGFKEALSLEDEEFGEVFPGFAGWRQQHGR